MMARASEMKGWQVKTKGGCLVKKQNKRILGKNKQSWAK